MMRVRYSSKLFITGRKQPPDLNTKYPAQTHTPIGMYWATRVARRKSWCELLTGVNWQYRSTIDTAGKTACPEKSIPTK
jgi:hypothetical protein